MLDVLYLSASGTRGAYMNREQPCADYFDAAGGGG